MAETYVKLTEGQNSSENITPGDLNQAVDVEKMRGRKCEQCGQVLPPTYTPPADEEWTTGICGCAEDTDSCMTGMFCPCVLFGRNVAALNEDISQRNACVGHAVCVEGGLTLAALTAAFHGAIEPDTVCLLAEGLLFAWWVCGIYTGIGRRLLQRKYHLKDSPCDPCLVHRTVHWCAICQEHREIRNHLSERTPSAAAVLNPPEAQEMNAAGKHEAPSPSSREGTERNSLQLQPL